MYVCVCVCVCVCVWHSITPLISVYASGRFLTTHSGSFITHTHTQTDRETERQTDTELYVTNKWTEYSVQYILVFKYRFAYTLPIPFKWPHIFPKQAVEYLDLLWRNYHSCLIPQWLMANYVCVCVCVCVSLGRGGRDQVGDQHAEEVLSPQEHRHLLWGLHQEEPPRTRWPALGTSPLPGRGFRASVEETHHIFISIYFLHFYLCIFCPLVEILLLLLLYYLNGTLRKDWL